MKVTIRLNGRDVKTIEHTFDPRRSGVESVLADRHADAPREGIYTIDGRKVEDMSAPGFYIANGYKVIKK